MRDVIKISVFRTVLGVSSGAVLFSPICPMLFDDFYAPFLVLPSLMTGIVSLCAIEEFKSAKDSTDH